MSLDETKDYYQVLGISSDASIKTLKEAYVHLALKYHPDTAKQKGVSQDENSGWAPLNENDAFINISEAWGVLSKPDTRKEYDLKRRKYLNRQCSSGGVAGGGGTMVSADISTQQGNFQNVQAAACSNWRELKGKYRTEKWRNLSLSERKLKRARPVNNFGGPAVSVLSKLAVASLLIAYTVYA